MTYIARPSCIALLISLTACSSMKVKVGTRISLTKTPISAMQVSLSGGPGIAPGEEAGLIATLTGPAGAVLMTEGRGHGRVLWKDLVVTGTVVTADKKGNVRLPLDPQSTEGKLAHVSITVPSQPTLRADLDIPIRYDYPYSATYPGSSGTSGFKGQDGSAGSAGSPGSTDPDHPSPGGNGGAGGSGSNGDDGGRGSDGPPVSISLTLHRGLPLLLEVSVSLPGYNRTLYLIDPNGGSLTVSAPGGRGGSGGAGGQGGAGGSGGSGSPSGSTASTGLNGNAGNSGADGSPGLLSVTYDPAAEPYLSALRLPANTSTYTQAPIPPLW